MATPQPTQQQKADQAADIKRALELVGITDKTIVNFLSRRVVSLCVMAFYDGQIAQLERDTITAENIIKKGGWK